MAENHNDYAIICKKYECKSYYHLKSCFFDVDLAIQDYKFHTHERKVLIHDLPDFHVN